MRVTWMVVLLGLLAACACKKDATIPDTDKPAPAPAPAAEVKPMPTGPTEAIAKDAARSPAIASAQEELAVSGRDLSLGAKLLTSAPAGNAVLSPWSIAQALGMTEAGAKGDTLKGFETVLKGDTPDDDWHRTRSAIEIALRSRGVGAKGKSGPFRLNVFNQLYGRQGMPFEKPFLTTLYNWYGAGIELLDFAHAAEDARKAINADVAKATEQLIPELLKPGILDDQTGLVLVNAVYFNGGWARPFDKALTKDAPFHLAGGETVQVPTMRGDKYEVKTAVVDGVTLAELPYDGEQVTMLVMMPPDGGVAGLETKLAAGWLDGALQKLQLKKAELQLPKFKLRSQEKLAEPLSALGLKAAFQPTADFTGMSPQRPFFIDDVVHEAVVDTDEEGTEAAAATAVVMTTRGMVRPFLVHIDRPFVFLIRDTATGAPLFLGRVMDPR